MITTAACLSLRLPRRAVWSRRALGAVLCCTALLASCAEDDNLPFAPPQPPEPVTCEGLFGAPMPQTGLDEATCGPTCLCSDGPRSARTWDADDIQTLIAWPHVDPPAPLEGNPYLEPEAWPEDSVSVCAVHLDGEGSGYRLQTWPSREAAQLAGGLVTHDGACGLCSSLQDLAVYVTVPNLTEPVRACGMEMLRHGEEAGRQCIADVGFSEACTSIWYWNTVNTRDRCAVECLTRLNAAFNEPDGSLNPCLQCDEDLSGPVFKAASGRTRRNSGLPTAICRPCGPDIAFLDHDYGAIAGASAAP